MRVRVKGRFYVFLLILLVIVYLLLKPYLSIGEKVEVLSMASSSYTQTMDAVIIRDESVVRAESIARVEYVAAEDTLVNPGDTVVYLYSTGYSASELVKLEKVRENIQAYHKTVLRNIIDNALERMDLIVSQRANSLRDLVTHRTTGNLLTVARKLETAMVNRQEYMRSNMRNDLKLNNLYAQENARLNSISSWRVVSTAERKGVVSFYLDGYEDYVSLDRIGSLTVDQVQNVLGGVRPEGRNVREQDVYRLVDQDHWCVAICSHDDRWNPVNDQEYTLRFEGYEDLNFSASVLSVNKVNGVTLALFEVDSPIGALIYRRAIRVRLSTMMTGISVSVKAVSEQNGQTGVWLYDVPGGTFVPVTVLNTVGDICIIEPLSAGALSTGQRVLIK